LRKRVVCFAFTTSAFVAVIAFNLSSHIGTSLPMGEKYGMFKQNSITLKKPLIYTAFLRV